MLFSFRMILLTTPAAVARSILCMGANFSGLITRENIASEPPRPGLGDLPESCVALVLSFLEPSEICRLALVNRTFRRASSANTVWESKLPENYELLVKKLFGECPESLSSKKQIYARLCCRNRFVDDNKEVWLEKNGGRVCVSISWKGLKITGIDDRRRWSHISTDESRFHTVAYLQETWWLEVQGGLDFEFPAGSYSLFFRLHMGRASKRRGRRVCDVDQVHGWNKQPVQFQLSSSDGWQVATKYYLTEPGKWIHYHVGDFVVEDSTSPTKLKFSMTQIDCTHNKGGLCLDSVLICSSKLGEKLKCLRVCELENCGIA